MSIQVVTPILHKLVNKYGRQQEIYLRRPYLDRAFSKYEGFNKRNAMDCINSIDIEFFRAIDDDMSRIKSFIFNTLHNMG